VAVDIPSVDLKIERFFDGREFDPDNDFDPDNLDTRLERG
jgi:hypothetical protein